MLHVEDARERLIALNRAVPEPTKEELADSEAEEQSRTGITFKDRALLLVKRGPVTVNAARIGEPTLVDPPQVTAPAVHERDTDLFNAALQDKPLPAAPAARPAAAAVASAAAAPTPDASAPLQLENVPNADGSAPTGGAPAIGAQIISTGDNGAAGTAPATSAPPREVPPPADPGAATAAAAAGVPRAQRILADWRRCRPDQQSTVASNRKAGGRRRSTDVHSAQVQTGTDSGTNTTNAKSKKKPGAQV